MTLKSLSGITTWLLLLATAFATMQANAQSGSFDVVSIRQNISRTVQRTQQLTPAPDGFRVTGASLEMLIATAYRPSGGGVFLHNQNMDNLPDWGRSDRYDIDARVSDADRTAWQDPKNQPAMLEAMLQAMLTERFKLAVHRASKEVPVYDLVVAKGGPKLTETKPDEPKPSGLTLPGGGVMVQTDSQAGRGAHLYNFSMGLFASLLTELSDRQIKDKTGLTGRYDMSLLQPARIAASVAPDGAHGEDPGPSMFDVVKGLGLKLEPTKEEVETLVVDHVERPTEN